MLAAFEAACCAAKGVPLREPRNPSEPELFQLSVLPTWSVMVTIVLLNVACTCAMPNGTFLRSRFLNFLFLPALPAPALPAPVFCSGFAIRFYPSLSSCRQLCPCAGPCGCGHWCGYAGREPANPAGDDCHGSFECRSGA